MRDGFFKPRPAAAAACHTLSQCVLSLAGFPTSFSQIRAQVAAGSFDKSLPAQVLCSGLSGREVDQQLSLPAAQSQPQPSANTLHLLLAFRKHSNSTGKTCARLGISKKIIKLSLNTALISECFLDALSGVNYLPSLAITESL